MVWARRIVLAIILMPMALAGSCCMEKVPLLSLSAGYYHAGCHHSGSAFQAEYKLATAWHHLRPQVGVMTPRFHSLFFYGGLGWDFYLARHWVITPSLSPGLYFRGKGRDLGSVLEFRSCIELACELRNKGRVGVEIFHISNASISEKNPGANCFAFFIAIPL